MTRFWTRPLLLIAALALLGGLVWAQTVVSPKLVFDDSNFDYYAAPTGYLHFSRDIASNTLYVTLDGTPSPDALPLTLDRSALPEATTVARAEYHDLVGIDVSGRSIEIPFDAATTRMESLIAYFQELVPSIGFAPRQEIYGGNTYVFACGCTQWKETSLRLAFDRVGDAIFARLTLQTPLAY